MFGSDTLETAIGVTFFFVFASVLCTSVREAIESFMKSRAKDLEKGLREILNAKTGAADLDSDDIAKFKQDVSVMNISAQTADKLVKTQSSQVLQNFYQHPLIYSLFSGDYKTATKKLPSYIPSSHFAGALLDIVAPVNQSGEPAKFADIRTSVLKIPNNDKLQQALLYALDTAEGDIKTARLNLESWYDASMDRVAGWYKRRTQRILFILGLLSAVVLNLNTITIAERLSSDSKLRAAVVAEATKANDDRTKQQGGATAPASQGPSQSDISASKSTDGQVKPDKSKPDAPQPAIGIDKANSDSEFVKYKDDLKSIGLPIGWDEFAWPDFSAKTFWVVLQAIAGWLITAFAMMLGAPFWFDVLNKLVSLRSSLKPDETTKKKRKEADDSAALAKAAAAK